MSPIQRDSPPLLRSLVSPWITCRRRTGSGRGGDPGRKPQELEVAAHLIEERGRHSVDRGGRGRGKPVVGRGRLRIRRRVEQEARELYRRDSVDHAVMRLTDHPDAPIVK